MCPLCQLSNQDTIFNVKNFLYCRRKMLQKNMPPINAFCINCNILIKRQSVDAFCTKNFSLMQNASTLPTHFVTKKSKCYNCNIGAKCVVSMVIKFTPGLHVRVFVPPCTPILYILSQTFNATRNEAEFDRSKFSRRTKMTNFSQQQPINILKPLIFVCL